MLRCDINEDFWLVLCNHCAVKSQRIKWVMTGNWECFIYYYRALLIHSLIHPPHSAWRKKEKHPIKFFFVFCVFTLEWPRYKKSFTPCLLLLIIVQALEAMRCLRKMENVFLLSLFVQWSLVMINNENLFDF